MKVGDLVWSKQLELHGIIIKIWDGAALVNFLKPWQGFGYPVPMAQCWVDCDDIVMISEG